MKGERRVTLRWTVLAAAAVILLATGAAAMYLVLRAGGGSEVVSDNRSGTAATSAPAGGSTLSPATNSEADAPLPDVTVTLTSDAAERAGIVVGPVAARGASTGVRLPGVVEPNAYRQVVVTPLIAGRVTRVMVELGDRVRPGETMAQLFSPELAEAQTRYISARADLEAHERELRRTEKLVEIGAASRQELERIHAEHTSRIADVQSARSLLELLGVPPSALDGAGSGKDVGTSTNVPAPMSGVVTERLANVGLNVDPATKLFTVVDLSSVWVIADLYEKDFSRVQIGSPATVTTKAYPNLALQGRIAYIDPQVSPQTRTAKVRVEVPNPRNELRLGMYADVLVGESGRASTATIPRGAVQNVGDRHVVYLVDSKEPGKFTEREVRLGSTSGEQLEVLSGLQAGDVVVTEGSFFVRAERERLGLRQSGSAAGAGALAPTGEPKTGANVQTASVVVSEQGFQPAHLTLRAGVPARITFVRTSDKTCGTEVVFAALNIKRALPLDEPVVVEFTPAKSGEIRFACGMDMLRGVIAVE